MATLFTRWMGTLAPAIAMLAAPVLPTARLVAQPPSDPAVFLTVDCLLPAQVRKMGRMMTYLGQRRPVRTSASDCEIRGGEYVASDRADYRTAFQVWMPQAQAGDPKAQTYIGEILEKGLGRAADYSQAAFWYERAVAQNYAPAKVNLAHLLADGLGVAADRARADSLLLQAANLSPAVLPVSIAPDSAVRIAAITADRDALAAQLRDRQAEIDRLTRDRAADQQALVDARAQAASSDKGQATAQAQLTAQLAAADRALAVRTAERDAARADARAKETQSAARAQAAEQRVALLQGQVDQALAKQAGLQSADNADRAAAQAALASQTAQLSAAVATLTAARDAARQDRIVSAQKAQLLETALAAAALARDRLNAEALSSRQQIEMQQAALRAEQARLAESEKQLAALRAEMLPPGDAPVIELIEPTLMATRGVALVQVNAALAKRAIFGRVRTRDPISLLTVNGQRQSVDTTGLFQLDVPLGAATTIVQIVAIDRRGRRGQLDFQMHREQPSPVLTAPPPVAPPALRLAMRPQHALLIGNARYTGLPGLKTPAADVEEIGRILRDRYGFQVTILHDASRYQMLSALNALRKILTAKDDLLVYYAGHGHKEVIDGRERGYWLPVDAEQSNPANWISTLDVTDMLASMEVHKVLLISDSCYSGLLTRGLVRLSSTASDDARATYLKTILEQKSRNVLTSGSDLPVLDGGGGTHSIFAKALARILLDAKGPLQGQDLAQALQQSVTLAAQSMNFDQRPQYGPLQLAGHEGGDYILLPINPLS